MSWTKRALEYMHEGYSEADATAIVAAERRAAETSAASEAPDVTDREKEFAGQLTFAPDVCHEDAA